MSDPMDRIEEAQGQRDIGATGFRIFEGARQDGASKWQAFLIVVAWFKAALTAEPSPDE